MSEYRDLYKGPVVEQLGKPWQVRFKIYTRMLSDGTMFTIHYWPSKTALLKASRGRALGLSDPMASKATT